VAQNAIQTVEDGKNYEAIFPVCRIRRTDVVLVNLSSMV